MATKKKSVKKKKSTRSRKKTSKSRSRKSSAAKKSRQRKKSEKAVDLMVQINEPVMIRRDVLEALRDVIIFMQSYEHFKKVQEEKMALFNSLQDQAKELNLLLSSQLKAHLPKGKLESLKERVRPKFEDIEPKEEVKRAPVVKKPVVVQTPKPVKAPKPTPLPAVKEHSEIDMLEAQLQDIESQLKNLH